MLTILCPNQFRNEKIPYNPIEQENWRNKIIPSIPYQLMISTDGIVFPEAKYKDICYELNYVRIAFNHEWDIFEFETTTNGFTDLIRYPHSKRDRISDFSNIYWEYELMDPFFERWNIIPIYSDMNFTWGWYDDETGLWTGGSGAVIIRLISFKLQKAALRVLMSSFCPSALRLKFDPVPSFIGFHP